MNLLIVESPNKIKKIKSFLGSDWEVEASVGHFRDLGKKGLCLNRNSTNYEISYVLDEGKESVVKKLTDLTARVGKSNVWLATDPDREGEAIAFHLCEVLALDKNTTKRVTFMEITEAAVRAALAKPRVLDQALVAAQEARRALDRLVGYEVSPALIASQPAPPSGTPGFSAGRVQSVAARLVADVEETITGFAAGSGLRFPISAVFTTPAGESLPGRIVGPPAEDEAQARAQLSAILAVPAWGVVSVQQSPVSSAPICCYSTSGLQQDGVKKLKFSVAKVTELSQKLFEKGHVSYIRTDSVNIGPEGTAQALAQITQQYGAAYARERKFKEKPGVQGGHEAIRPTHWEVTSAGDTSEEQALYQLIYARTLASQMSDARYAQTIITLGPSSGEGATFESRVRVLEFDGYRAAYQEAEEEAPDGEEASAEGAEGGTLKVALREQEPVSLARVQAAGRVQKPPKRYDEATLVAEMEKRQIGRPSTYASIIKTIFDRQYVQVDTVAGKKVATKTLSWNTGEPAGTIRETARTETLGGDKNKLVPTPRGIVATAFLKTHFADLIDYGFTAACEERLDSIAHGKSTYIDMLREFDAGLLKQKAEVEKIYPPKNANRAIGDWRGLPIIAFKTKYGPRLRYGPEGEEKAYSLPDETDITTLTLEKAIEELERGFTHKMRKIGEFEGLPIEGGISKAEKPYIRWNEQFIDVPPGVEFNVLTPSMARATVEAHIKAKAAAKIANLVMQIDKNWSIVRRDDGSTMLMLVSVKDNDKCQLRNLSEAQAQDWDVDKARAEMKKWKAYKADHPRKDK